MNEELNSPQPDGEADLTLTFSQHRDRLIRLIDFRLDPRLQSRVDPDDVLQEAFIEMTRRWDAYRIERPVTFYIWARQITLQTLIDIQRRHFGQKRTPQREKRPHYNPTDETGDSIARIIESQLTTPSRAAIRAEEIKQLHDALDSMDPTDREVLALRHFEHMGNAEVAEALGLTPTAASNRYVRAMTRLGDTLRRIGGSPP